MDLGLKDKVALVHGAGGGLGGAIARALAAEGATIVVCDVDQESLQRTCQSIVTAGGKAIGKVWNLAELDRFPVWLREVEDEVGPVEILCNNTGGPPPGPVQQVGRAVWEQH